MGFESWPFTLARRICTIAENTEAKMKHLENLKMNLSKYQYPKQLTEFGIKKALSIPLQELRTPKTTSNHNTIHNNLQPKQSKCL